MEEVSVKKTFGEIKGEYATFKKAKAVIVPCPYEATVTYEKGTARGPEAIINASCNMELFDEELGMETYRAGIHTMPPLEVGNLSPEQMIKKVSNVTADIIKEGKMPIVLGGEHTVTIGAVQAAKKGFQDLSVLYLDAHYDLRDEYSGSKYNHACVARRIAEICPIIEVATRSMSKEEKDFLNTRPANINVFNVYDILDTPDWKEKVTGLLSDNVYISVDIDTFDPSLAPSVGTPEPGGIGWYELLDLLKLVTRDKKVMGFDVTELCPKQGMVASDFLAAKLIYRLLGYIVTQNKG
jgi:agmatinase